MTAASWLREVAAWLTQIVRRLFARTPVNSQKRQPARSAAPRHATSEPINSHLKRANNPAVSTAEGRRPRLNWQRPAVLNPPQIALSLQKRALAVVLEKLGIDTIAWPLASLLIDFDAPHAFYIFAEQVGCNAETLLFDESAAGASERVRFREANDLLLEAEGLCRGTRLSPDPIASTLRTGHARAYELLQLLEDASAIDRQLQALAGHPWKSATGYEAKASDAIADWPNATARTLAGISEALFVFRELERTAREALRAIAELSPKVRKAKLDPEFALAAAEILRRAHAAEHSLYIEPSAPENIVNELLELLDELETLLNATHARPTDSALTDVQSALVVFGLDSSATIDEVTAAYRRLAKKYHPDHNSNSEEAMRRMQEINAARDTLRHYLSHVPVS